MGLVLYDWKGERNKMVQLAMIVAVVSGLVQFTGLLLFLPLRLLLLLVRCARVERA